MKSESEVATINDLPKGPAVALRHSMRCYKCRSESFSARWSPVSFWTETKKSITIECNGCHEVFCRCEVPRASGTDFQDADFDQLTPVENPEKP